VAAGQLQQARLRAEERRSKVSEMYFRLGMRQQEIAEQLSVSQPTVARDVKILVSRWREASIGDIEAVRGKELADLSEMERDCALQFQNTKDPRWVTERRLIKKRRADMLGLDAPVRLAGADGGPIQIQAVPLDLTTLSDDQLQTLEKIMERQHGHEQVLPQLKP
jgi:transposase